MVVPLWIAQDAIYPQQTDSLSTTNLYTPLIERGRENTLYKFNSNCNCINISTVNGKLTQGSEFNRIHQYLNICQLVCFAWPRVRVHYLVASLLAGVG